MYSWSRACSSILTIDLARLRQREKKTCSSCAPFVVQRVCLSAQAKGSFSRPGSIADATHTFGHMGWKMLTGTVALKRGARAWAASSGRAATAQFHRDDFPGTDCGFQTGNHVTSLVTWAPFLTSIDPTPRTTSKTQSLRRNTATKNCTHTSSLYE